MTSSHVLVYKFKPGTPWGGQMLGLGGVETPGHSFHYGERTDWSGCEFPLGHHCSGKIMFNLGQPRLHNCRPLWLMPSLSILVHPRNISRDLEIGVNFHNWLNLGTQLCSTSIQKLDVLTHAQTLGYKTIINFEFSTIWSFRKIRFGWLNTK